MVFYLHNDINRPIYPLGDGTYVSALIHAVLTKNPPMVASLLLKNAIAREIIQLDGADEVTDFTYEQLLTQFIAYCDDPSEDEYDRADQRCAEIIKLINTKIPEKCPGEEKTNDEAPEALDTSRHF